MIFRRAGSLHVDSPKDYDTIAITHRCFTLRYYLSGSSAGYSAAVSGRMAGVALAARARTAGDAGADTRLLPQRYEETELTIRRQFVREQYVEGARDFNRPKLSATTPDKIAGTLADAYDHSPRPHQETFEWRLENGNTLIVRNGRQPAQTFYRCR